MKVLIAEKIAEDGIGLLRSDPEVEVDVKVGIATEELAGLIADYQGLVVRSQVKVRAEAIDAGDQLICIARAGAGVDNIDLEAATRRGIVVVNSPQGNTLAATEHTMAMLLAMVRNIPAAGVHLRSGSEWKQRSKFMGVELYDKVLGVMGLGNIGREVARRAQGFDMNVIAYDPYITAERAQRMNVRLVDLDTLMAESDFITLHVPDTEETRHLINRELLAKAKDGIRIINVARGKVVDEEALVEALKSGKVAGAALDVFEKEPPTGSPLLEMPNVVVTPHLGASTEEAQSRVAVDVCEQMLDVFHGRPPRSAVNMPAVPADEFVELQPYLVLAERIGKMQAALAEGAVNAVEVEYSGELASKEMGPATYALLKGVLQPFLEETVNFINARVVAESRGVRVVESKSTTRHDYPSVITVTVKCAGGDHLIAGTLFGRNEPRIVRIDQYRVDFPPEGHLMIAMHRDAPGTIGRVGTILGSRKINIAGMHVGRTEPGGRAVMALAVDSDIPADVLQEIRTVAGMEDPKVVHLF